MSCKKSSRIQWEEKKERYTQITVDTRKIMEKIIKKICSGFDKGNCKVQAWIKRDYGPDDLDVE